MRREREKGGPAVNTGIAVTGHPVRVADPCTLLVQGPGLKPHHEARAKSRAAGNVRRLPRRAADRARTQGKTHGAAYLERGTRLESRLGALGAYPLEHDADVYRRGPAKVRGGRKRGAVAFLEIGAKIFLDPPGVPGAPLASGRVIPRQRRTPSVSTPRRPVRGRAGRAD